MKNIWRIIFWGIILIISLSAGVLGVIYSNQNFNKRKNDLVNIVETFNSNQLINDYKKIDVNLTAKLSDKNIIVSYTGNVNKDYIFKFKKNYLETTISKNDNIADIVVMLITDSISTIHGETQNSINDLFNSNIYNFKFSDGISYTSILILKYFHYNFWFRLQFFLIHNLKEVIFYHLVYIYLISLLLCLLLTLNS